MSETYRKFGRAVRYENGTFVHIEEAGQAVEDGRTFSCRPITRSTTLPRLDTAGIEKAVRDIETLARPSLKVERLVVTVGSAVHQFEGREWRETVERVHLSLAFRSTRVLIHRGDFELDDVRNAAAVLQRIGAEREAPRRLRLAPNVAAALLPSLAGVVPPNVKLMQSGGGFDGKGQAIETHQLVDEPWPNWYRPSYRSRPVRAPFHLRALCDVTEIDDGLPRAMALLAPPEPLLLRVLCADGGQIFPATGRITRIDAVAGEARWYPYGAGSFGAEMTVTSA